MRKMTMVAHSTGQGGPPAAWWVGYKGGGLIPHPFRLPTDDHPTVHDGPHYHAVKVGWNENVAALYARTGWVVHRIRVLDSEAEVARVVTYALTHAGVSRDPRIHDTTWWGAMAYSKLKLPLEPEVSWNNVCELCGNELVKAEWTSEDPPLGRDGSDLLR